MKTAKAVLVVAMLLGAAGAAQAVLGKAGHGKAGLWNVTTTMDMRSVQLPPEAVAQMKKAGIKMPASQSFASQMCMTQAEVDSDKPPHMNSHDTGCTTRPTGISAGAMTAEMVCNGEMKGRGRMQISFSGAEHYVGSYSFKGTINGQAMNSATTFQGIWVKSDCGAVKPFQDK